MSKKWTILDQNEGLCWPKRNGWYAAIVQRWNDNHNGRIKHVTVGFMRQIPVRYPGEPVEGVYDRWIFEGVEGDEIEDVLRYCRLPDTSGVGE